jgi:hypothetical protein
MLLLLLACATEPECTTVYETNYIYVTDTASSDDTSDSGDTTDTSDSGEDFIVPYPDYNNSCYCWINTYEECQYEIGLDIHDLNWLNSWWEDPQTCESLTESQIDYYECLIETFDIDCGDHEALQAALQEASSCF